MKRVDIKARLFFKGQGPKMLTGYYEYWRKHDTLFKMCYFGVVSAIHAPKISRVY